MNPASVVCIGCLLFCLHIFLSESVMSVPLSAQYCLVLCFLSVKQALAVSESKLQTGWQSIFPLFGSSEHYRRYHLFFSFIPTLFSLLHSFSNYVCPRLLSGYKDSFSWPLHIEFEWNADLFRQSCSACYHLRLCIFTKHFLALYCLLVFSHFLSLFSEWGIWLAAWQKQHTHLSVKQIKKNIFKM